MGRSRVSLSEEFFSFALYICAVNTQIRLTFSLSLSAKYLCETRDICLFVVVRVFSCCCCCCVLLEERETLLLLIGIGFSESFPADDFCEFDQIV